MLIVGVVVVMTRTATVLCKNYWADITTRAVPSPTQRAHKQTKTAHDHAVNPCRRRRRRRRRWSRFSFFKCVKVLVRQCEPVSNCTCCFTCCCCFFSCRDSNIGACVFGNRSANCIECDLITNCVAIMRPGSKEAKSYRSEPMALSAGTSRYKKAHRTCT